MLRQEFRACTKDGAQPHSSLYPSKIHRLGKAVRDVRIEGKGKWARLEAPGVESRTVGVQGTFKSHIVQPLP